MREATVDPETRALPAELRALLETRDAEAFEASLDAWFARRQRDLFRALGHLTRDLHESVAHLTREADHPDARRRLREALELGATAAHANLALAERLRPQAVQLQEQAHAVAAADGADRAAARQLAQQAAQFTGACLGEFTHLVETQSWQDLSGQRLQQVAAFIDKVEDAVRALAHLTGTIRGAPSRGESGAQPVADQDDVDGLLAEFGF